MAVLLPAMLHAQVKRMSLKEAVGIALEQNLEIEVAEASAEIADVQENWGNAGFLPSLNAQAAYQYSVADQTQEVAVGNDTSRPSGPIQFTDAASENYTASLTANYILFNGLGRLNDLRKLKLQKELSETQLRFTIENVLLNLFSAYFQVAYRQELLNISRESLVLSKQRFERAKTAYELGSQSRLESLTALVDLRQDSVNYWNTYTQLQKSRRNLNRILDFPIDTTVYADTNLRTVGELNYLQLQKAAMQNSAALIQAQLSKNIAEKNVNIAWSQRLPEVSASGGYTFSRQENEGGFLRFTESTGWQYGLTARWNIFNSNQIQTQIETTRLQVFQNDLKLQQARQQLKTDMANAWLDFENARKIFALQGRNLKVSRLTFARSQEAYELGQITNVQLREAQLNYINAKASLKDLYYRTKLAEIELQRVAGTLLQEVKAP